MTDREAVSRLLVLQKAILDVLHAGDADTRAVAASMFKPGAAEPVEDTDGLLGRVRMDKPRETWKVTDTATFEAWVREHAPDQWIASPRVDPNFVKALTRNKGIHVNRETGQVVEVPGMACVTGDPTVVVTTTEKAELWAQRTVGNALNPPPTRGEVAA